jgi:trk system potassium uptake protein TrkA
VSAVQADIYRKLGATQTIDPEKMAGEDLAERLSSPNLIEYIPLAPDYGIFEVAIPEKFIGKTIKEIGFRKKYHIQIIAIKDVLNDAISFLPNPDSRIQPDSVILFICRKEDFDKLKF